MTNAQDVSTTRLAAMHDFASKLLQPELLPRLVEYVRWQIDRRDAGEAAETPPPPLARAPISINLDLTTACNYACDHCVDFDILNSGVKFEHEKLERSLEQLAERGLRSVIVIGGGEPTTYPRFVSILEHMKRLGLQVGVVTNGSNMERMREAAPALTALDWVRLSLDAGHDATFQAMHRPKKRITLDEICAGVRPVKQANPAVQVGFSFIITWDECHADGRAIVENIEEIVVATRRARDAGFDYVSFKPFLERAEENSAEIVDLAREGQAAKTARVVARIRTLVDEAKTLERDGFRVIESTNLRVLENGTHGDYTRQPQQCHMQFFRQVLSPLGMYNCPVYRHVEQARVGDRHAWADARGADEAAHTTARLIETFDASHECRHVVCLYNHVNHVIEDLIRHPEMLDALRPVEGRGETFL